MALDEQFLHDVGKSVYDWIGAETKRADAAAQQNRDLIAVHHEGWRQTSEAILKGFGLIADAIRNSR